MNIVDNYKSVETTDNKKFYLAIKRVLLTYKTHLNKTSIENFFKNNWDINEFHICHEKGDENNPYPHSHVFIEFKKRFQSRNCRVFDVNNIHPNIKKVVSIKHVENCYKYLMKEDPACSYLKDKCKSFNVDTIIKCKTKREAMENAKNASDANQLSNLWESNQVYTVKNSWDSSSEDFVYWSWQKKFISYISFKPNRKHVITWIWDEEGQNGKNTLVDKLMEEFNHAQLTTLGNSRDIAQVMKGYIDKGWRGKVLHINISKSDNLGLDKNSYSTLEQLSDGKITSTKYKGCNLKWGTGHTIVYSNYPPDVSCLSLKRWDIKKIVGSEGNARLIDIPAKSLLNNSSPRSPIKYVKNLLSHKIKTKNMDMYERCEYERNKNKYDLCKNGFNLELNNTPILGPLN